LHAQFAAGVTFVVAVGVGTLVGIAVADTTVGTTSTVGVAVGFASPGTERILRVSRSTGLSQLVADATSASAWRKRSELDASDGTSQNYHEPPMLAWWVR